MSVHRFWYKGNFDVIYFWCWRWFPRFAIKLTLSHLTDTEVMHQSFETMEPSHPPPPLPAHHLWLLTKAFKLAIETGCYSRPFKKPAERICPICKIEREDEYHFLNIFPAYQEKRRSLLDYFEKEYRIKISRMSPNIIFMFLINPPSGNAIIQRLN